MESATAYDVVIGGASIAGCTAAILYGRAGLRVAVAERRRDVTAHKTLCGHFILGGTADVLHRTGLWAELEAAGAVTPDVSVWQGGHWFFSSDVPPAISLRREKLDPLLRRIAEQTPGVHLLLGHTVVGVSEAAGRVTGLRVEKDGVTRELRGRLVVGADGHRSPVATLAGVPGRSAPNERFLFWAYYRGLADGRAHGGRPSARVWVLNPDIAVEVPTDDGLTLVGAFPVKASLPAFRADRATALESFVRALPDAPDVSPARRVSKVIGTTDYPFVRRHPTPRPGLALIGDAATVSDPVPAVGCGWAFRSASWLADRTAESLRLRDEAGLERGLREYRRDRRIVDSYDRLARLDARGRGLNPLQRALFAAAPRRRGRG